MRPRHGYWVRNVQTVTALLLVWFVVSYVFGILAVDLLNRVRLPGTGFKLGFWFAQQGSIYVYLVLIWIYVRRMNRLDREHGVEEDE
jgi:putative solute:sodium symporter small subunit